jgi:hypothetical protein
MGWKECDDSTTPLPQLQANKSFKSASALLAAVSAIVKASLAADAFAPFSALRNAACRSWSPVAAS